MPDLTGIHANAQAQSSTSAADISKLAEKMAEGLTEATLDGLVHAFQTIQNLRKNNKESEQIPENSVVPQSLAERKENLKHLKDRLNNETREFRRDVRKNAVKVGLNYILSLFKNVKKFLKDTWEAPGIFTRGIKNKFSSLKDFMLAETKGEVKIGQEIKGNKQEQAEKFIKLLNTSASEKAPEGLENTIIAPWGENLIVVDENNNVTANLIQPLMNSEVAQLAIDRNTVAAAIAPNIQPVASSLASQELNLQGQLIGQDAIDHLLKNIQDNQLSKSTIQGLEDLLSEPSQVQLEALPDSIEQPLTSVSVEAETSAVVADVEELIPDPFNELGTQSVVITKAQLEDLSDDRYHDLKDIVYASLDKNDEFGSRLEKMKDAADKFITNDEYAALEQFEITNLQALVHKLESNITAEEVNIPEFAKHLAENPNSLPQDQETDLKSIQVRTEKLADAKALLTFIEAKYPAQQTANGLDQPKYTLIDLSLSELIVERDAAIDRARWTLPLGDNANNPVWEQTLDTLRPSRQKGQKLWEWRKENEIRPVVFRDPGTLDGEVVHLHLEHRLVQRLLSRFRSQGFTHHELSRACVCLTDRAVPQVLILGRLSIYGDRATRLHDEIVVVAADWLSPEARGKGKLRPLSETEKATALELVETSLANPRLRDVPPKLLTQFQVHAVQDVAELLPHLKKRAEELSARAAKKLLDRGQKEAKEMTQLLIEQRDRILEQEAKSKTTQLSFFNLKEQEQLGADIRHWQKRLAQIDRELDSEPQRIEHIYQVKASRIDPVGIVYLYPVSG